VAPGSAAKERTRVYENFPDAINMPRLLLAGCTLRKLNFVQLVTLQTLANARCMAATSLITH
jgi:hypothetical protein